MIGLLLFALQGQLPTVGDTLWAGRVVRLGPGDSVRAAAWELEGPVQLLGRPEVSMSGDRAEVRYPLVAWEAGNHVVDVPGPIITRANGVEDTLQIQAMTFQVRSVLPTGVPDSQLAVQPPATPVRRGFLSPLPPLILGALAVALLIPLHWWWRRRGKPVPLLPPPAPEGPGDDMVRRWADAGERRTVAGVAARRLRAAIERGLPSAHAALDTASVLAEVDRQRPDWPRDELRWTLMALDGIRFAPSRNEDALELYQRGMKLVAQISGRPV
jgi:hypothetical protein